MYPEEGRFLDPVLKEAESKGVQIKYVAMKPTNSRFLIQVVHPDYETIEEELGGRSFDLNVDKNEILGGLFITGQEDQSIINWGKTGGLW